MKERASIGLRQVWKQQTCAARSGSLLSRLLAGVSCFLVCLLLGAVTAHGAELANDTIKLDLEVTSDGIPTVAGAEWIATGTPIFTDAGLANSLSAWIPDPRLLRSAQVSSPAVWATSQTDKFLLAKADLSLQNGLMVTWVVELARQGSLFRLHVDYKNSRPKKMPVQSFPGWSASWNLPANPDWIRWWDALAYTPEQKKATKKASVSLFSHLYSSAAKDGGFLPYWLVDGPWGRLCFGIAWSGGWQAQIDSRANLLTLSMGLPPEETGLVLDPGEAVEGPRLIITPTQENSDMAARRSWMDERSRLGRILYGGPAPSFPLVYNHWYTVSTDVDANFLNSQIGAMAPYSFDAFIVDDGWFDSVGNWVPDPAKFQPGEFEGLLQSARANGSTVGLWSAPQYVSAIGNQIPQGVETPLIFNSFVGGYLLDLWDDDYKNLLVSHVQTLRQGFSIGWWKYDQPIFASDSNAGPMKDVLAFQSALRAVRRANPKLIIENCQDGGRMINELTLLATQLSWLLDQPGNDLSDVRSNIQVALGALDFMFPWSVYRWTNRLDEHQDEDEFTRYYCRSAMAGVWGISTDLAKIGDHQRSIILNEIQNYRRLNAIKTYNQYELVQPTDAADAASVIFYGKRAREAAVILYRWAGKRAFAQPVCLKGLDRSIKYVITDADTGAQTKITGQQLSKQGFSQSFAIGQLSALLFVEPAKQ